MIVARLGFQVGPVATLAAEPRMRFADAKRLMHAPSAWIRTVAPIAPLTPQTIHWAIKNVALGRPCMVALANCAAMLGMDQELTLRIHKAFIAASGRTISPFSPGGPDTIDWACHRTAGCVHVRNSQTCDSSVGYLWYLCALADVSSASTTDGALRPLFPLTPDAIHRALKDVAICGVGL